MGILSQVGLGNVDHRGVCVCVCVCPCSLSVVSHSLQPMDCSLPGSSTGFSRQEYRSGLPFPAPGDLLDSGINSSSLVSPALAGGFFTTAVWEAHRHELPV